MGLEAVVQLVVPLLILALVDGTSFGTFLIPVWLMLAPGRIRAGRILLYLGTVAGAYFLIGLGLLAGFTWLAEVLQGLQDSTLARQLQLALGVGLMLLGIFMEPWTKAGKDRKEERRAERERLRGPGAMTRIREQAVSGTGSMTALMGLAVAAVAIEIASMLPYLGAIGLMVSEPLSAGSRVLILLIYCLVMIAPALLVLVLRLVLHDRIKGVLTRFEAWMRRHSGEAVAIVVFLIGLFLTGNATQGPGS